MDTTTVTDTITLSGEQQALLDIMEKTNQHLFITGRAGAGKSVLLRKFRETTKKRVVIAAPTGIAALNVKGQTIHSLFKLAPELYYPGSLQPNDRLSSLLKGIETLVIDEISMVRADLLDAIDDRLREACKSPEPFGGKQIIMFGDVYQLPPVVDKDLTEYFEHVYEGYFFFHASVWKKTEFKIFELSQVFRQKDPIFKDVLNSVRDGSIVQSQIDELNTRYGAQIPEDGHTITLAPTNSLVTNINQRRLEQLAGEMYEYKASITGKMNKTTFPTEEILQLKVGAQVVLLQNDKEKKWVNGTVATIASLQKASWEKGTEDRVVVLVNGTKYILEKVTWEEIKYDYDSKKKKVKTEVVSSFTQFPIRLAWALTIHKSQGQTYESVALDLSSGTFAPGQMYVALSRATSLEGLYLKMPIKRSHIIVDAKVKDFMQRRSDIEILAIEADKFHHDENKEIKSQEQTKEVAISSTALISELHHDEIISMACESSQQKALNMYQEILDVIMPSNHDNIEEVFSEITGNIVESTIIEEIQEAKPELEPQPVQEPGRVSRVISIEVLCPRCGNPCINPSTGEIAITYDLVGHSVACSVCKTPCIVPLNAFSLSLQGNEVKGREKPAGQASKREKKGRTQKERKSKAGRKTKGKGIRQPMQLSLERSTIDALNFMGVNKSELFEDLLSQYEPFNEALAAISSELAPPEDDNEYDDDMEDEEEDDGF